MFSFNLFPNPIDLPKPTKQKQLYQNNKDGFKTDSDNLKKDWEKIGQDFNRVLSKSKIQK